MTTKIETRAVKSLASWKSFFAAEVSTQAKSLAPAARCAMFNQVEIANSIPFQRLG